MKNNSQLELSLCGGTLPSVGGLLSASSGLLEPCPRPGPWPESGREGVPPTSHLPIILASVPTTDEEQRVETLRRYQILDTPPELAFDDLALLAARTCQAPVAMISFMEGSRLWCKASFGPDAQDPARDAAFCTQTLQQKGGLMEVADVLEDSHFSLETSPAAASPVRFYAGVPLVTPEGYALGTLCVKDFYPRKLTEEQRESLRALGRQVVSHLELRRETRELARQTAQCEASHAQLRVRTEQLVQSEAASALRTAVAEQSRFDLQRTLEEEQRTSGDMRASEVRLRQIVENIQEVFWMTTAAKDQVLYVSPAYEAVWGRTCASLYAEPHDWMDSIHPDDRPRIQEAAATRMGEGPFDEEYRIVRADGTVRWVRDRAFPVRDAEGKLFRIAGVARDITSRKQNEDRLKEQASLLDKAQDAIIVRDLDHHVTYWNKSAERLYGWTAEEVLGRTVKELVYRDTTTFDEACRKVVEIGEWVGELDQINKSGAPITVEGRWTLLRDTDGQPKGILAINTDVTQHKKMENQILRAQRMESIGALAGGIAHDLNNVLTPITMAIDFLRLKIADSKCQEVLETIASSAKRGADMVGQVLSFARGVEGRRIDVQPRHLITDIDRICRETFPKDIQLDITVERGLWTIQGDPTQLHQVLLNLCVNARDAMLRGGILTMHAKNVMLDSQFASMNIEATPGPHVVIEVQDTGTGISQEVMEKIFDPFFTTKELGKGTGLGLSTSLSIVKSHGGFMQVESEVGRGTKFLVHLPAMGVSLEDPEAEPGHELPRGDGELVLVVDDEAFVRQITRQTLEAFGYRVMLASEGAEAVTLYAQHKHEVSVVLTDMMMPVMDGASTIMVLRRMNPDVCVIAASGVTTERNALKAGDAGVKHFIPKPYTADTLLTVLRKVLQKRS